MPMYETYIQKDTNTNTHIPMYMAVVNGGKYAINFHTRQECERKKNTEHLFLFSLSPFTTNAYTGDKDPFFVRCKNQKSMLIFLSWIERSSSLSSMKEIVLVCMLTTTVDSIENMMASFFCALSCARKRKHKCAFTPTRQQKNHNNRQHSLNHSLKEIQFISFKAIWSCDYEIRR